MKVRFSSNGTRGEYALPGRILEKCLLEESEDAKSATSRKLSKYPEFIAINLLNGFGTFPQDSYIKLFSGGWGKPEAET